MTYSMFYKIAFLPLFVFLSAGLYGQNSNQNVHLDPLLRLSLQNGISESITKTIPGPDQSRLYPVVIHGTQEALRRLHGVLITDFGTFGTAHVSAEQLGELTGYPGISHIEYAPVHQLQLDVSRPDISADSVHAGFVNNTPYTGDGVIIGIIDTGIDFYHKDFRDPDDPDKSRILRIWDISLEPEDGEDHPELFDNGVEYTRDDIENELRNETNGVIRSRDKNGHGTHVAGVAGGGGVLHDGKYKGIAPDAEFIVVQFSGSGITTAELIHGMEYIFYHADKLNRPAVINISLGGHSGAHDGTAGHEQVIDFFAQDPGKVVVVAAGNSGEQKNHTGTEVNPGTSHTYTLNIQTYSPRSGPDNDFVLLYMWYEGTESLRFKIETPNGYRDTVFTADDEFSALTPDGAIEIYTNPEFINPKGARIFTIYLSDKEEDNYPAPGNWRFTVRSTETADSLRYNTWIVIKSMNGAILNPSTNRAHTVTMPGTAEKAVTVGAYNTKLQWFDKNNDQQNRSGVLYDLTTFSGGGPTRDLRLKPDITAPGRFIGSSLSQDASISNNQQLNDEGYAVLSGTSISTPHVTGLVALMLEANPLLRTADVQKILHATARGDDKATDLPNYEWGWGKADAFDAVREASRFVSVQRQVQQTPENYVLFQNYPNPFNPSTNIRFHLPERTLTHVRVYDVLGREVETLVSGELDAGIHTVTFHPRNMSSGVYYYRLETSDKILTRAMLLMR